jgi:hypothetical protein
VITRCAVAGAGSCCKGIELCLMGTNGRGGPGGSGLRGGVPRLPVLSIWGLSRWGGVPLF